MCNASSFTDLYKILSNNVKQLGIRYAKEKERGNKGGGKEKWQGLL
jgi:hypothetical protein